MNKVNYKSDFKLIESGGSYDVPFTFDYHTWDKCKPYRASHIDGVYTNCRLLEDGKLLVVFDQHGLSVGELKCERHFYLTDADFADGVCNLVTVESTGVMLVTGRTDECEAEVTSYPGYAAYNAVQCSPLSGYEYEDVLSGFVPPEPPSEEDGEGTEEELINN